MMLGVLAFNEGLNLLYFFHSFLAIDKMIDVFSQLLILGVCLISI